MHRTKRMSRKKLTIVSLATVPLVAGLGFAVTQAAFAGTNGQSVELCQPKSDYRYFIIQGQNQDGARTTYRNWIPGWECPHLADFYWKGRVEITWQNSPTKGIRDRTTTCDVPEVSDQDSVKCFGPDNSSQ